MTTANRKTTYAAIAIVLFALVVSSLGATQTSGQAIPRNEIVWGAGFAQGPTRFQPWNVGNDQGWDTYMMYEPLFGTNVATGELIKWIGKSITWLDNKTIQVVIRSEAKWTDNTSITSDDVIFDFKILQQQNMTGSICDFKGYGRLGGNITDTFVKVNATTFNVLIKNNTYIGSVEVYRALTFGWPLFPKSVWTIINQTYCEARTPDSLAGLTDWANDWQPAATPAAWKVASGMYLPYWHDLTTTIAKRNDNWWGKNVADFGRLPVPKYMGYTGYSSNDLALLALERGDLDWGGKYFAALGTVMAAYPNVVTYFPESPYFADKATKLLVPNYKNFPLNATWLHKALSKVMDYDGLSALSSGYLKKPSALYIPQDDAAARSLVNTTIEASYAITYDVTAAKAILSTWCTYNSTSGVWWTKQGVTASDPIKHYPLAKWPGKGTTNATANWEITNFYGWTDVTTMDIYVAQAFTMSLDIDTIVDQGPANSWDAVHTKVNTGNFDFYHHVMAGQFNMNLYERYYQLFSPKSPDSGGGIAAPLGGYQNSTLVTLIESIDSKIAGSQAQWDVANQIENIIGQVMPFVPIGGHPDWQIYSTTFWSNWPNSVDNKILPSSPYAGLTQNANNLLVLFRLAAAGGGGGIDMMLVGLVAVVVIVAVAAVAVVLMRRKPGK